MTGFRRTKRLAVETLEDRTLPSAGNPLLLALPVPAQPSTTAALLSAHGDGSSGGGDSREWSSIAGHLGDGTPSLTLGERTQTESDGSETRASRDTARQSVNPASTTPANSPSRSEQEREGDGTASSSSPSSASMTPPATTRTYDSSSDDGNGTVPTSGEDGWASHTGVSGLTPNPVDDSHSTITPAPSSSDDGTGTTPPPVSSGGNDGTHQTVVPGPTSTQADESHTTTAPTGTQPKDTKGDNSGKPTIPSPGGAKSPPTPDGETSRSSDPAIVEETAHGPAQAPSFSTTHETDSATVNSAQRVDIANTGRESEATSVATGASSHSDVPAVRLISSNSGDVGALTGSSVLHGASENSSAPVDSQDDEMDLAPQGADLITSVPQFAAGAVQAEIQAFLHELDHLGAAMFASPEGIGLTCWMLSAAAAAISLEIARRQMRRRHLDLLTAVASDPSFSWVVNVNDNPAGVEA
jgi:hypothetical protein